MKRIILEGFHIHHSIVLKDDEEFPPEYCVPDIEELRFGPFNFVDPHRVGFTVKYFYPRWIRTYSDGDIDAVYMPGKP